MATWNWWNTWKLNVSSRWGYTSCPCMWYVDINWLEAIVGHYMLEGCMVPALCHILAQYLIGTHSPRGGVNCMSLSVGVTAGLSPAPVTGGTSSFFTSLNFISQVSSAIHCQILCNLAMKRHCGAVNACCLSVFVKWKICNYLTYLDSKGWINCLKLFPFC